MKRKFLYFVILCMVLMFAGCSSAGTEESNEAVNNQKTETGETAQSEDTKQTKNAETAEETEKEKDTETKQVSLNVENDTFTFDALIQQIGASEESAMTLLGAEEKGNSYSTELFGEAVVIVLEVEDETVKKIQLDFADTDAELLTNAIAEQLGNDGETEKKTVSWELEGCSVVLQKSKKGCSVEISGQE